MGNSGAAISESTAPSYYNPSLLRHKNKDSFSFSGTTFNNFSTKTATASYSALNIAPSYLSDIHTGDSVNHELFFINLHSGNNRLTGNSDTFIYNNTPAHFVVKQSLNQDLAGYSMAFRNLPLAMQFAFQYLEVTQVGSMNSSDLASQNHTSGQLDSEFKKLDFALGLSTHIQFGLYTFAVNYLSRGIELHKSSRSENRITINLNGVYSEYTTSDGGATLSPMGQSLLIGHGFHIGAHEFLTDTSFREDGAKLNQYSITQSFGYRYQSDSQTQFFCGLNHELSPQLSYFGQRIYVATGFSWQRGGLRSALGPFFYNDNLTTQMTAYGLNFASEYRY